MADDKKSAEVRDVASWLAENERFFVPPVCNKCMFSDQLKMFFVGGPNQRRDYHLQEGEEVFYQLKCDMCLKVVENGVRKDIIIREGELFLLPSRVEHSPQRYSDTIGAVVERERANTEFDCVRYFIGDTVERQLERWFHLTDVVKDLPPLIRVFMASKSCATNTITDESFIVKAPFEPCSITLDSPVNVEELISATDFSTSKTCIVFGAPKYRSTVALHGVGVHEVETTKGEELLLWTVGRGEATFTIDGCEKKETPLSSGQIMRVQPSSAVHFTVISHVVMSIRMPGHPAHHY